MRQLSVVFFQTVVHSLVPEYGSEKIEFTLWWKEAQREEIFFLVCLLAHPTHLPVGTVHRDNVS